MDQESIMFAVLAVVVVVAIVGLAVVQLSRQRLIEASLRQRERSLQAIAERFGALDEFVTFATSADAQRLFQTVDGPSAIARRLLAMAAAAIVLSAAGSGFLLNSLGVPPGADLNIVREADAARWWGVMLLAVGIGSGIAGWVCGRLARHWGVLDR